MHVMGLSCLPYLGLSPKCRFLRINVHQGPTNQQCAHEGLIRACFADIAFQKYWLNLLPTSVSMRLKTTLLHNSRALIGLPVAQMNGIVEDTIYIWPSELC